MPQHQSAEMVAEKWGISRARLRRVRRREPQARGRGARERALPRRDRRLKVKGADGAETTFDQDEGIRPDTTLEKLAGLKFVVKPDGVVTAGTASQISDGAAALLVTTPEKAKQLGLKPRARVKAMARRRRRPDDDAPRRHPGDAEGARQAPASSSRTSASSRSTRRSRRWCWRGRRSSSWSLDNVNVNGGAVALGHPLGCSGARLMTTLLHEMEKRDVKYGLQTMCIGFGQATCTIIERI